MDLTKIGACLRDLRKEKGLTQEQLAEQLNVSQRTVSRWETGSVMPDIEVLLALADFYEVDLRALLNGEAVKEQMSQETKETVQEVVQYSKKGASMKKRIMKIVLTYITASLMIPLAFWIVLWGFNPFPSPYPSGEPVAPGWERTVIKLILFLLFLADALILSTLMPKPLLILPVTLIPFAVMIVYMGDTVYAIQHRIHLSYILIADYYFDSLTTVLSGFLVLLGMLTVMIVRMVKQRRMKLHTA